MSYIGDNGYGPVKIGDDLPDSTFKAMAPPSKWGPFNVGWSDTNAPHSTKPLGYRIANAYSDLLIVLGIIVAIATPVIFAIYAF